ncbi:MAG: hypothetical protein AAGE98_04160 [Actinomycetota bacterium]
MTDFTPDQPLSELDLRRALTGQAAAVHPRPDRARLDHGLRRADRIRTVRAAALSGVCALATTFAVLNLNGTLESSTVDTVDQPGVEEPTPTLPELGDPDGAVVTMDETTTSTTTNAPTTPSASLPAQPDHLTTPSTTTSAAPATTTVAPTTTQAPATTQAPTPTTTTQAPSTTTTAVSSTTTTVAVTLTANARYGSCELDPPYDVYTGAATPGATITISSPWSDTVQTIAGGDGTWEITVFFPTAPTNEPFDVTISDGVDTRLLGFAHVG